MAGERQASPLPAQPGGRPPAPGPLGLVQAFLNTHYDFDACGGEMLGNPRVLASWLLSHGLLNGDGPRARIDESSLRRALALREGLRELALANNGRKADARALIELNDAAGGAVVEIRLAPQGPRFVRSERAGVDGALGVVLALTAQSMLDGTWRRLKACPGEHCGWAFYDASRNQTGRWCSMSVCGGRAKARAYYRRQADGGGGR